MKPSLIIVFQLALSAAVACAAEVAPQVTPQTSGHERSPHPAAAKKAPEVTPEDYYGRIAQRLGNTLPRYHVLQQKLDDTVSRRAWTNLVTFYDYDHSVFLKGDLDRFAAREKTLDDEIHDGNVSFGYDVYALYVERLRERMQFATNLLARTDWDFSSNEVYRVKRKDAPWPETTEEAEDYWRRRIRNEVLVTLLNKELDAEKKPSTNGVPFAITEEVITNVTAGLVKKYRQYATVLSEPDAEAVLQHYLSAIARAYDPHSDYMSPTSKEDFDMEMNLSLSGVGAVLSMDDGALKIVELSPGGPVERDGRIKVGDKITGVQQGDGEMEDITWQPMKQSIRKIRGPKGTRVTLEIIPRSDPSGMERKRYELVRDEIRLDDQAATGRVETVVCDGESYRLGYVFLPGFYGTMDKRMSDPGFRSCSFDTAKLIAEFNSEGVDGMILDLRGNGGGSLREAVFLSALFVDEGPVVQIRDVRSVGALPIPGDNVAVFRRPLVVMTDRASASASEIVAGHLRDVGRAIVVGDRMTHGKGTVQTVMGMGPDKFGSCKITTARFYRVNGSSTQVMGVPADIHLPSLLDSLDIGEDKLTYALPFSRILPADYSMSWHVGRFIPRLRELSAARLKDDARYLRHTANVAGMREISERTDVPLEREARKAMMRADRELRELDAAEADDEDEETEAAPSRRKRNQKPDDDVVLDEAFRVLADLVRLTGDERLPKPKGWWE